MYRINLAISGPPRNGTSALRKFINVDPRIMIFHESGFFRNWDTKFYDKRNFKLKLNLRKEAPEYSGIFLDKGLDFDKFFEDIQHVDKWTGSDVLDYLYNNSSAVVVGDKNPISYIKDANIVLGCPDTKMVAILRDGRDAICSYIRHWHNRKGKNPAHWAKPNVKQAQLVWLETVGRMWSLKERDNFMMVRYEDVLADKQAFIKKLHTFLGLEYQMVDDTNCPYYEPFQPIRVGIWEEEIPDILSQVSDTFIHYMKLFDYL